MVNLRRRILVVTLSLIIGTVTLCSMAVYLIASHSLWRNLDAALLQIAKTEIASATDTGSLHVHETGPMTLTVKGVPGYEKYVWIEDDAGQILASTGNVPKDRIEGVEANRIQAGKGKSRYADIFINGEPVRALFYPFENLDGRTVIGIVGVPSAETRQAGTEVGEVAFGVGLLCVLFAAVAAVLLSEFVTVPISDLAKRVARTDPLVGTTAEEVSAPYAELDTLVQAINDLSRKVSNLIGEREKTIDTQRQFIADTSHELRTPTSNLRGTIEVALRRDRTCEEYREALQTALSEVKRLSRLIDDLLTLAKSDIGEFSVHLVPSDVVSLAQNSIRAANSGMVEYLGPATYHASIDPDRIRQALDNLLRNAITHADSRIQVRIEPGLKAWSLKVGNDGPSLSPNQTDKIFERFVRLDESRSRDTGGSGLGLAIVRAIAEGHGGHATVSSETGWTEFRLTFPGE